MCALRHKLKFRIHSTLYLQHFPGKINTKRHSPGSFNSEIVSEYDQEIPQSQTADNPVAPQGRAAQPSLEDYHMK